MKYIYILWSICMLHASAYAQTATGVVVDTAQRPLSGVTILLKGSRNMAATNDQGRFSIRIDPQNQILQLSATGYHTLEIPADTTKQMLLTLHEKISALDAVQVIGYGTTTQRYNVGSVSTLKAEDIARQPIANPLAALQGRVPGLVVTASSGIPGAGFQVQIRGQNTLSSSVLGQGLAVPMDNPLFIVDGVPFAAQNENLNQLLSVGSPGSSTFYNNSYGGSSPFNSINPADIASIEVLRDADATAIYGSRGGNGVILITTKKGMAGKTDFTLDVSNGASVVGKTMPMMHTAEYLTMRREAIHNDGLTPNLTLFDAAYAPDLLAFDTDRYTDWPDYFFGNTANNTVINASLSGGNSNTNYRLSAGFNRNTYIFPGDYADNRGTFAVNVHHSSADNKFRVDFSSTYSYNKNNSSGTPDLLFAYRLEPNFPDLLDENDELLWSYNGIALGIGIGNNPVSYLKNTYYVQNTMLNNSLQVAYKVTDALSFRTSLGYNAMWSREYFGNPYAAQNPLLSPEARANFGNNNYATWIIEPQMEYRKAVSGGILGILVGGTLQRNSNLRNQIQGRGYINDDLIESINAAPIREVRDNYNEYAYAAAFGRINYVYQNRYILNLNARRDGSSRFGPGRQFGNFGSLGAGWLFAEETVVKDNIPHLSYGKLRASYGITGSDAIGDYQFIPRWATTNNPYNGNIGYEPQNLFNPLLGWGSTKKLEFGLELGFWQDRMLLNAAWYRNRSGDQLISYYLPSQSGFTAVTENWDAQVQNTGVEVTLQTQQFRKKDFSWSSAFNLSIPNNKLRSFPGIESSSYATRYVVGQSLNTVFGYDYVGVNPENGLFEYRNAEGERTSRPAPASGAGFNDYISIGTRDPVYYGGIQNTWTYKGVQLDVFLEFKKQMGVNYLHQVYAFTPGHQYNVPRALLDRWQSEGDIAHIQRFTSSFGEAYESGRRFPTSSGAYTDASYLRFRTINIAYQFPAGVTERIGLKNLRVYGAGQNLFTISKYLGNDPETQSLYNVPVLRTFVLGLQFTL